MNPLIRFIFNPHAPGPIGDTTPASLAGTTFTVTDGNLTIKGATSTTTGISIGGPAQDWIGISAGGNVGFTMHSGAIICNIPVNANGLVTGISGVAGFSPTVGGNIFNDFTDAPSVNVDGTEDTLYTHTLSAGALNVNGAKVCGMFQLAIVGHAVSTDRIRLYFGGTAIFDTTALNFPLNAAMTIVFEVIRVSATVVRAACFVSTTTATVMAYSQYVEVTALTLSNTQVIALKSISTGTNSAVADVTAKLGKILWHPAA